ncbi:hypothetical protein EVAR_75052_1 [Eumeta japonica]|uniref:Uncharacterized protein n=1 Tax=Eumeta variegata TaxID=151549 RepID=A0A4C1W3E3_EUMVA|nr:hypothetical protein EVAR_75052_1 [Eumeta japonica]
MEQRFSAIEKKKEETTEDGVNDLAATVNRLQHKLNDHEQEYLLNHLKISGIPETKGKTPIRIAILIDSKLGVSLDERDIVSTVLIGIPRAYATRASLLEQRVQLLARLRHLPALACKSDLCLRPLMVRLLRCAAQRDDMLSVAQVRCNADTSGFN